jgi:hypothetical protein
MPRKTVSRSAPSRRRLLGLSAELNSTNDVTGVASTISAGALPTTASVVETPGLASTVFQHESLTKQDPSPKSEGSFSTGLKQEEEVLDLITPDASRSPTPLFPPAAASTSRALDLPVERPVKRRRSSPPPAQLPTPSFSPPAHPTASRVLGVNANVDVKPNPKPKIESPRSRLPSNFDEELKANKARLRKLQMEELVEEIAKMEKIKEEAEAEQERPRMKKRERLGE